MMDGVPQMTRREQLKIVAQFTIPLFQRAFGMAEPYADYIDNPPSSALYTIDYEL